MAMLKQAVVITLCAAMVTTGCASASGPRVAPSAQPAVTDSAAMAEYVQRIAAGSRVRVERTNGGSMRGTLMKATSEAIVVQRNTRAPEPPVEIPVASITRITLDTGGGTSTAKAIGIGIAAGVGTFFGILAILAAAWND
jgi:hypothetical protein